MAQLRRLYDSGNSVVVAIPPHMLAELDIESGHRVALILEPPHGIRLIPFDNGDPNLPWQTSSISDKQLRETLDTKQ